MRCYLLILLLATLAATPVQADVDGLPVLCFHDVRDTGAPLTELTVSSDRLLAQFSWLRGAGYQPVSLGDVLAARRGERPLPHKAVLLTFDDGYSGFYTRVYPLLRLYGYPAVLSLVGAWMEKPPGEAISYGSRRIPREAFLSWEQVREMVDSGLVEIASHSYDLHRGVIGNPQGNRQPAAATRIYDPRDGSYEDEDAYRRRVTADLRQSLELIEKRTGHRPRSVAWPFGRPAPLSPGVAAELGLEAELLLERKHRGKTPLLALSRRLVPAQPSPGAFANMLQAPAFEWSRRAVRVSLDDLYAAEASVREKRLGNLLERVLDLGVSTVFLEAFSDADGDVGAEALYFPNEQMPVRADLFNRVAWQLMTRSGVEVYAVLPQRGSENRLLGIAAALARQAHCHGLLFDPQVRLAGSNPEAALAGRARLMARARALRPRLRSIAWQSDPQQPGSPGADWTLLHLDGRQLKGQPQRIAQMIESRPQELERTFFYLDRDVLSADPLKAADLAALLRSLQAAGARHLGYGPDDFTRNAPPLRQIAPAISQREYPNEF